MKWGNRYNHNYVNNLYNSIKRHTIKKTQLICFTDDKTNIHKEVICKPLPHIKIPKEISETPWRKLSIWKYPLHGLYACGELVGGVFLNGYPGGSGLTSGAVFGRKAGSAAALGL